MSELLLAGAAGVALGAAYFGGLWLTVRRLAESPGPARLALASLAARLILAAAVFWWVATLGALPALAALGGFLAARQVSVRRVRRGGASPDGEAPAPGSAAARASPPTPTSAAVPESSAAADGGG